MQPLSSEQARFINQVASSIVHYGLQTPILLTLEAGRPLAFLGGQFLWIAQPALSLFWPRQQIAQLATLFENPHAVQALKQRLEQPSN